MAIVLLSYCYRIAILLLSDGYGIAIVLLCYCYMYIYIYPTTSSFMRKADAENRCIFEFMSRSPAGNCNQTKFKSNLDQFEIASKFNHNFVKLDEQQIHSKFT